MRKQGGEGGYNQQKKWGSLFSSPQKRQRRYRSDKNREMHQRLPQEPKIPDIALMARNGVTDCSSTVSGCRMRFLRAGVDTEHPPLLLIHGLLGYSFSWRFNLAALAQNRVVYAVDLPGVGFSDRSAELDCSVRATAERLLCFVREQGITSVDILGTSHGGGVAMLLSALARQQSPAINVNKLVLVAPINPWSRHGLLLASVMTSKIGLRFSRAAHPWFHFANGIALGRMYGSRKRISPGTLEGYAAPLQIEGTMDHALKIAHCLRHDLSDIKNVLSQISDIRTLLVWGDRDRAVLPESAPLLKAHFSNAELKIIKGSGHLPYEEFPDEFNRTLFEFLDRA